MATEEDFEQFAQHSVSLISITKYNTYNFKNLNQLMKFLLKLNYNPFSKRGLYREIRKLYLDSQSSHILILDYAVTSSDHVNVVVSYLRGLSADGEKWRFISYPDVKKHVYQVSNQGRIRVVPHLMHHHQYFSLIKIKQPTVNDHSSSPLFDEFEVAKLVSRAFNPNPNHYRYVQHINSSSHDQSGNLRWVENDPHEHGVQKVLLRNRKPASSLKKEHHAKKSTHLADTPELEAKISEMAADQLVDHVNHYDSKNHRDSKEKVHTSRYVRSPYVRELTLRINRDQRCQLCGKRTFLQNNDHYYFESHHITPLSKHGVDAITNTVALCPTCHRKMHLANSQKYDLTEIRQKLRIREMRLIVGYNHRHPERPIIINPVLLPRYVSASIWYLTHQFNA